MGGSIHVASFPSSPGAHTAGTCRRAPSRLLYSIGFVIATGTLHAVGIGMVLVHRWPLGRASLRVAGALVALAGAAFLWRAIAPGVTL